MKKPNFKFTNSKIRTKLFISYVIIISIVAAASIAIYKIYENNTVNNIEETSQGLVQQLSNNISNKLSSFEVAMLYATDASGIFKESDFSDYVGMKSKINTFNMYLESSGATIYSDLFLRFSDNCCYCNGISQNEYKDTDIYKYIVENREKILKASGKAIYVSFTDEPGKVYVVKTDITMDTHVPDGFVAISISDKYFKNLFPKSLSKGSIVICDKNSDILLADDSVRPLVDEFNKTGIKNVTGQSFF